MGEEKQYNEVNHHCGSLLAIKQHGSSLCYIMSSQLGCTLRTKTAGFFLLGLRQTTMQRHLNTVWDPLQTETSIAFNHLLLHSVFKKGIMAH